MTERPPGQSGSNQIRFSLVSGVHGGGSRDVGSFCLSFCRVLEGWVLILMPGATDSDVLLGTERKREEVGRKTIYFFFPPKNELDHFMVTNNSAKSQ